VPIYTLAQSIEYIF